MSTNSKWYVFFDNNELQENSFLIFTYFQERWDPTEIIASPFPVEALRPVVFQACRSIMTPTEFILTTILLLYQGKYSSTNLDKRMLDKMIKCTMNYMIMMAALSIIMLVVSIFCGASPFANIHHTVLASMFFTQMAFGYIQPNDNEPIQMAVKRVFLAPDYTELTFIESLVNELNCYILYGTVVMTIPFVVLNILDGGMQIQRWPIPIILGSFYGHILGFTIGTLVGLYRLYKLRFGKRNEELQNESSSLSPSPLSKERQA